MNPSWLDITVRNTAISSILGYQRYISPHKGYACAYRILHRDSSCSEYAKQAIAHNGFWAALPLIRQRFQACKQANQTLKSKYYQVSSNSQPAKESDRNSRKKQPPPQRNYTLDASSCEDCTLCCDAGGGIWECGAEDCSNQELMDSCAKTGCGESPELDCGGADCCSGVDCSGVDCCSCG